MKLCSIAPNLKYGLSSINVANKSQESISRAWRNGYAGFSGNIKKLCEKGRLKEAIHVLAVMDNQRSQEPFDRVYYDSCLYLLQACIDMKALAEGRQVHFHLANSGLRLNVFIRNTLISMYSKCGCIDDAREIFEKIHYRNVFSWTIMIDAYVQDGKAEEALRLFRQMQQENVEPNQVTYVIVLTACSAIANLEWGKEIHLQILKTKHGSDMYVSCSLVDMYSKCGSIKDARQVFDAIIKSDVVPWNVMIASYVQHGDNTEALRLFGEMQSEGVQPDKVTFASVLTACAGLSALDRGRQVHSILQASGCELDILLGSTLVDMYAKCGNLEDAFQVFTVLPGRDVKSWSAMISGYAQHGDGEKALTLFEQMQLQMVKPDGVAFTSVLTACSHACLVNESWNYFHSMVGDHSISPILHHYACMVDLLGRAGYLHEALAVINMMPLEPSVQIWRSLLGGCKVHSIIELSEEIIQHVIELDPYDPATFVLFSNMMHSFDR